MNILKGGIMIRLRCRMGRRSLWMGRSALICESELGFGDWMWLKIGV